MKRDRRGRFLAVPGGSGAEPPGPRRLPGTMARGNKAAAQHDPSAGWVPAAAAWTRPAALGGAPEAGIGRALSTGYCRLCHGKFSSRSLRNAFGKVPVMGENSEKQHCVDQVFFTDFQRLVGVAVRQDPMLPQFVCKKCHAQFYKCHSILRTFIQRVNTSPTGHTKSKGKSSMAQAQLGTEGSASCLAVDLITSSLQCLHNLVSWTHRHAESCTSAPSLQSVLSSEYCSIIRAIWGCSNGHDYIMDTDSDCSTVLVDSALSVKQDWNKSTAQHLTDNGAEADNAKAVSAPKPQHAPVRTTPCQQPANKGNTSVPLNTKNEPLQNRDSSHSQLDSMVSLQEAALPQPVSPLSSATGQLSGKQVLSTTLDERVKDEFSDLSEGDFLSDDENEKRNVQSSDDSFEPYPEKKISSKKSNIKEVKKAEEPKTRKKPGPKPGWKKKIKCEREELPTIYKCPYQGCTAVYRGADGMKKHIKEHHEEVRERPCPHPGCNKVFMIDRYLQRHVKLIHTEVRNYICDECGQTFKQRKHLSVHQMRHSGAKPLQCEICGFQCRQRASLKYHMTKHKAETELEFACDQCGKRFEKAHNLNVHMSMVHPLIQIRDKAKPLEPEPILLLNTSGTSESQVVKPEVTAQQEPT
ncbi:zinc finger protein 276-like isoform X2 [Strigops habroptila]|uniref:zinc finger protein 276-like isoform X2 n=1 Tax=Strigops habroptila TaxID=2489341 RepID=UPI0011CEE2CB|nr:zinc finger protein 276-like isoform X2 [Strigops habroptila]